MSQTKDSRSGGPLQSQLRWFIRLRWIVGAVVLVAALIHWHWQEWYARDNWRLGGMLPLALVILLYNAAFRLVIDRVPTNAPKRLPLLLLSWAQIFLDLTCLTLMTLWTGGLSSPLLGFYVFHMVFASLLLPRQVAYASAGLAIAMLCTGVALTQQGPQFSDDWPILAGWIVTLVMTVHLANRLTRSLRRQRRRLLRQNRHIRLMTERLRRQQQAMIQQEKMVAVGQMAAGVAHEIANPLASMDSLLQLMQRRPDRVSSENMATVREQIGRISQIVRQMTAFAHPAEGQWEQAALNDVVEQAVQMVRFDPRLKGVTVNREYSPDAGALWLIPRAVQQVLVNLIINAMDAVSSVALPTVTVRTSRSEQWCIIEVSDNGMGIQPDYMDRLFEPFFTTKPLGKGTGLGLSISYSLIRKQGGSIDARSAPGEGATFTVRLPATANVPAQQSTPVK